MSMSPRNKTFTSRAPAFVTPRLQVEFFDPTALLQHAALILKLYASVTRGQFGLDSEVDVIEQARAKAVPEALCRKGKPPAYSYHMLYLRRHDKDGGQVDGIVEGKEVFVGFTSIYVRSPSTDLQLGYAILPEYQGKRYATEAAAATLRYWFDNLGVERVEAITTMANVGSRRVADRCGGMIVGDEENGAKGEERRNWAKKMLEGSPGETLVEYVFTRDSVKGS